MTNAAMPFIDVLICTYRRPDLLVKTLDGVERCAEELADVRVVVVDNDSPAIWRSTMYERHGSHSSMTTKCPIGIG